MNMKEILITMVIALVAVAIAIQVDSIRKIVGLPPKSTV